MTAREAIQVVVEHKAPPGWAAGVGIYGNYTRWPYEIQFYVKCPKCGQVHGDYKTMREAHAKRLCGGCNVKAINDIKDQITQVDDPDHKVKPMAKIVGEAIEPGQFDPFDEPPEIYQGVPIPPEDEPAFNEPADTKGEIERLLLSSWVDVALRDFANSEGYGMADIHIDESWGDYDPAEKDSATKFKIYGPRTMTGDAEWLVFKDEDAAKEYALVGVKDDLEYQPELFTQTWLENYVDEEKLRNAIGDPYEDWEQEIEDLDYDDLLQKMVDENYLDFDDPLFFKKNGDLRVENPVRSKKLFAIKAEYIEKQKPTWEPWDWLEDVYGKEKAVAEAIKMVGIDIDKAAEDAVETDGWQHFVALYDGISHDLDNGGVYCRIN